MGRFDGWTLDAIKKLASAKHIKIQDTEAHIEEAKKIVNKYHAERTEYNGIKYHSKFEARYAMELDLRKLAGDIRSWERQHKLPLVVNGVKVGTYIIDFVIYHNDASKEFVEVKGAENALWKLKYRLALACYGWLKITVVYDKK